jgi:hypothetical protein
VWLLTAVGASFMLSGPQSAEAVTSDQTGLLKSEGVVVGFVLETS